MAIYNYTIGLIDKFSGGFAKLENLGKNASKGFMNLGDMSQRFNNSLMALTQTIDVLNAPIQKAAELSDKMAIVQKNTGATNEQMKTLKDTIDKIDTRTATKSLLDIASVGGKLGVPVKELEGFVKVIDMANVALGDEFGNNAELVAQELAKIKNQFKEFEGQNYETALMKVGSAVNFLGKQGANSAPNLTDFAKRFSAAGLTLSQSLGIGATLEELGMDSERAASGVKNILDTMAKDTKSFAKVMGINQKDLEKLVNTDKNAALQLFLKQFKGASTVQIAETFKGLKIGSQEASDAVLKLSGNTDLLAKRQIAAQYAIEKGTDLNGEFALMNNTLAARMEKTKKKFDDVAASIGGFVAPYAPLIQMSGMFALTLAQLTPLLAALGTGFLFVANSTKTALISLWKYITTTGVAGVKALASFTANLIKSAAVGIWSFAVSLSKANFSLGMFLARIQLQASLVLGVFAKRMAAFSFKGFIVGLYTSGVAALKAAGQWIFAAVTGLGSFISSMAVATASQIALNFAMYANPIGIVIAAILALGAAVWLIIENWDVIKQWLYDLASFVMKLNPFGVLLELMDSLFPELTTKLGQWWDSIVGWIKELWGEVTKIFDWVSEAAGLSTPDIKVGVDTSATDLSKLYEQAGINPTAGAANLATGAGGSQNLGSGVDKMVTSNAPKNFTITIQNLVENLTISTTNLKEGAGEIKRAVSEVLASAVNDSQLIVN